MSINPRHSTWGFYDSGKSSTITSNLPSPKHLNVKATESPTPTHMPHPAQPGLWAHSHDPETDLMKRYVVEVKSPSGWVGVKSFDDTDSLAAWLWSGHESPTVLELSVYRLFDQKLGRVL